MEDYEDLFVCEKQLGRGAFGKVYKVRRRGGGNWRFALKVLELESYQATVDDVMKEFNVMVQLNHRNILSLHNAYHCMDDSGRWVTSFAIQMEYCPFGDLTHVLRDRRGMLLRPRKLVQWMQDLTSAVKYIHSNNIIHRDLKPDNILLDRNSVLRISDFGLAKVMTQYYATSFAGTRHFLAPEVIERERYTKKADIYSLGKVFICMATLQRIPGSLDNIPDCFGEETVDIIANCINPNRKFRPKAPSLFNLVMEL